DNDFLNQRGTTAQDFGYAVFGRVIEGLEVVDAIAGGTTANQRQLQTVPVEPVLIKSIVRK
ncbi:MAG: peptidylprolyl isomerase, partial [Pseudohongiella sp.]|nr:peptidylprolyl isomerase [Pseudohongiella sp.]